MFWLKKFDKIDHRVFSSKIRLKGKGEESYLWTEIRILAYFDTNGPVIAFGCISNINVTQLWQMELQHSAETDVLTGFYNKAATQKHIEEYLSKLTPRDLPPALIMIDADGFKAINDSFGHLFGDGVLADMSLVIRSTFRQKDIIGRIGGDEFMVFMPNLSADFVKRADEISAEILNELAILKVGTAQHFSCSIGIGTDSGNYDFNKLYKLADKALYESKERGKACYVRYSSDEKHG